MPSRARCPLPCFFFSSCMLLLSFSLVLRTGAVVDLDGLGRGRDAVFGRRGRCGFVVGHAEGGEGAKGKKERWNGETEEAKWEAGRLFSLKRQ